MRECLAVIARGPALSVRAGLRMSKPNVARFVDNHRAHEIFEQAILRRQHRSRLAVVAIDAILPAEPEISRLILHNRADVCEFAPSDACKVREGFSIVRSDSL